MTSRRSASLGLAGIGLLPLLPWVAHAQPAAPGPVTLVVPFAAGGGTDALTRLLATALQTLWGVPVVVENKPGAGTTLASAAVARAAPDGRTLIMASLGHAVAPALYPRLGYDPATAFAPVVLVATGPNLLLVHPGVNAASVRELVALARREPGRLSYASFGNGTSAHLAGELFALDASIELLHVPYRGSAPAVTDLIGGQVQMMFDGLPSLVHVRSGKLRALAVTSSARHAAHPELPTVAESGEAGLAGFPTGAWFGLLAPAGSPVAWLRRVNADVRAVLRMPTTRTVIERLGFMAADEEAAAFGNLIARETSHWQRIIKQRNITAD